MSENQLTTEQFDLIVIGGGPAGYVGAIRAAQLGMKVALIEKRQSLGGTCLNEGCIPSKALLHSSELYEEARHNFASHGISLNSVSLDVQKMLARKNDVVQNLTKGIDGLFKKNKITRILGSGIVMGRGQVMVQPAAENLGGEPQSLYAKNILLATGSEIMPLPGVNLDGRYIVSSKEALDFEEVPHNLVIIGGGVIGLELGSVWRRLGAEVTVVEFLDEILPGQDGEIRRQFRKILEKQGVKFKLGTKVTSASVKNDAVHIEAESTKSGKKESFTADKLLVAIGRRPFTKNLGLGEVGVKLNSRGRIEVDANYQTSVKNIYAVGDVIEGPMLAHKAEEDAVAAVEIMAGEKPHIDYNLVPSVIYTNPEVASVGKTEEQLKEQNIAYKIGKFPFMANSRARAVGFTEGFVKILADKATDKVLGVHIIGLQAGTMISEAVTAMEYAASSEDIARTIHSHPDFHEAIKEAALSSLGRAIHI
jgi:dihydrolipoamide dehydrogenase